MTEPTQKSQNDGEPGQARKVAFVPLIALLGSLSPVYLSLLILIVALVLPSAFEPPTGHSSALYSPNIIYLFALGLPMVFLVPFGFVLGLISVVKDRRRGSGPGHPLAWGAVLISGMCLLTGCASAMIPALFMPFLP